MDTMGMEEVYIAQVYTWHVDIVIIFLHVTNTRMMSRGERKLDRLKRESKGATNEAPNCAVPMHGPQTNSFRRVVGEVSIACEVGCWRRVQPRPFLKACQGVGGRTPTQEVDQKRTAGTGTCHWKVVTRKKSKVYCHPRGKRQRVPSMFVLISRGTS